MLRFFKKIRHQQLPESRVGKYLLYAIGEILLVVIGILIAIRIDNANEKRQIREKEGIYLNGLHDEFLQNRLKLETLIKVNHNNFLNSGRLLHLIDTDSLERVSEKDLSRLIFEAVAYEITFNPNNSLLSEMINSGSLKDLSDSELRRKLAAWESNIANVHRQENELRHARESLQAKFLSMDGSVRTIFDLSGISEQELGLDIHGEHFSNKDLMKSRSFENQLLLFMLTTKTTETVHYAPLLNRIDEILSLLKED